MVNEPFYNTRPVMYGGINGGYIVLDRRWGIHKKDMMNFSVHIHGHPDEKYHITKAVGSRGNSLVLYLPCNWEIPVGALCVVEATPLKRTRKDIQCDEDFCEDDESEEE